MDSSNLLSIAGTVIITLLTAIGYFLKDIRTEIKNTLRDQDQAIEKVADDLADFKASLPTRYVMRDDFLRAVANQDYKLDMLAKEVGEMNKNLSKLIGGQKQREST